MPIPSHKSKASQKTSKGDTSRTSSQGRKAASGGSSEVSNQGHPKGSNPQNGSVTSRKAR
jgi:hypothetical protein